MDKAFLPHERAPRPHAWRRLATIHAVRAAMGETMALERVAKHLYGDDGEAIMRAAVSPTSTAATALLQTGLAAFLADQRVFSAAADLIQSGLLLDLSTAHTINVPVAASDFPQPTFVAEGAPIPVLQGNLGSVALGPPKKLAAITAMTGELHRLPGANAEAIVSTMLNEATGRSLDAAVFSTTAASANRPAGILNGVSALTPSTSSGMDAFAADVGTMAAALHENGAGVSFKLYVSPKQALRLFALQPQSYNWIFSTPALADRTAVMVDPASFVSGFGAEPIIEASREAVIHYEDTNPAAIGTAASPNVVAATVRSAFQHDLVALRLILPCAWAMRSNAVAWMSGVNW